MGSAVHTLTRSQHLIMKCVLALLFLAGLALAQEETENGPDAEADPAAWYYGGYYGYPYHRGYYGYGGYRGYSGHRYGYWGRKKRDAEADPAVLASTSAVTTTPVTYTVPHALTYAHHYPYTYGYGHLPYLKKREAEADANPEAWYGHYYGYPGYYGHRYYGYGGYYGHPYGYGYYYGK